MAALVAVAVGQERDLSSPYFDCPYINYFDNGCPQTEPQAETVAPPNDGEHEQPEIVEDREGEYEWLPLFPKESLAPDTPPLYRLLLIKPTLENARRYVRWYARRMNRIRQAQELVDIAGREFLAETSRE